MRWVIQSNIYQKDNYGNLLSALDRLKLEHIVHKVVPFTGELEPEVDIPSGSSVVVLGSYSMARHAVKRGWKPGAFLDNLDFSIQVEHWGNLMLNSDAKIYPFSEIPFQAQPFF